MTDAGTSIGRHRGCLLLFAALAVAFSSYVEQVSDYIITTHRVQVLVYTKVFYLHTFTFLDKYYF